MADEKLRLVSICVRGGALDGRSYEPDEVVTEILVGSDPDCHLVLADEPGISPIHARIEAGLGESVVHDTHAPRGLWVNDTRVQGRLPLGPGDLLWLGPPEDPGSVCVSCQFAPWVEVLPASPFTAGPEEALPEGEPVTPIDAAEALAQAFATPDAPGAPAELAQARAAVPPPAAERIPASPDEDPFFVDGGEDAGLAAPAIPPSPAEPPLAVPQPAPPVVPQPVVRQPVVVDHSLSPEALVAETIAEDWAIAEPAPDAQAARPAAAASGFAAPPAEPAGDEFFIADASASEAPTAAPVTPPRVEPGTPADAAPPVAPASAVRPEPRRFVPEAHPETPPARGATPDRGAAVEPPRVAPRRPAPPPRPTPASARPSAPPAARSRPATSRPASARRPSASARPARRPSRGAPAWLRPVALGAAALGAVGALAFFGSRLLGGGVRLDAVEPARVRVGQRATLAGSGFAADPSENTVLFDEREAKVLRASATQLEVQVPEVVAEAGAERRVAVVVRRGRRASSPLQVPVLQGPRLHGISPEAALPGEIVLLAGAGWGPGASVRFGAAEASIQDVDATRIRAIVPEGAGGPGTEAPVVVTVGGVESNPAPFIVGHLPVVSSVSPATAAPGDLVDVKGRGFRPDPAGNYVRVGGAPALVVSSSAEVVTVAVPFLPPGEASRRVELRVAGSSDVGEGVLQVTASPDPVAFRFVAQPFTAAPGRPYAVLATGLGPAFVLAESGGRTAAARAAEAATRLNGAADALRTTLGLNLEARDVETSPTIGLAGRAEALVEVTEEDAAAYGEDWAGLRVRGGPVTRARLARWWEALARDIVLLTVRGERPRFAAGLAPEGRVLGQLFDAAQRTGRPGVPREVVDEARPALREGLRLLALRVPASVPGTGGATSDARVAAATPRPGPLALEGTWAGSQSGAGDREYLTVRFQKGGGSIAYESGITFTVPFLALEPLGRDQVRFSVPFQGGVRHYAGKWDGETLSGPVSTDAAGKNVVARFELRKR